MSAVRKLSLLLLITAMSGACTSSAGAADAWHTNGPKAFSSTNAGAARWIVHPASGSTVRVDCPSSSMSGTLNGPTSSSLPWTTAGTMTPVFGSGANCTVSGVPGYSVPCDSSSFAAISYSGGSTFATAAGGHVTLGGTVHCRVSAGATTCSTFHMTWEVTAINPVSLAAGAWRYVKKAVQAARGWLKKIGIGCAALPDGTVTFGAPSGASGISDLTFSVDGPNAPYLYYGT